MSSRGSHHDEPKHKRSHRHRSRSRSPRQEEHRHRHKVKKERHDRDYARERSRSPDDRHRHSHQVKREREDRHHHHHHHHRPVKQERPDRSYERNQRRDDDRDRRHNDRRREAYRDNPEAQNWGREERQSSEPEEKEKPTFELSGKLTEDTNTFRGVVIKYNEPPEARKPRRKWRLYPFKGEDALPVMHMHRQSAYLFGRQRKVADIPIDHPSCSKQHAVFQYRLVDYKKANGMMGKKIQPYIIDLGSANGTYVNNNRIEPQRYVELFEKDVIKFGFSSREYVLLHDSVDTSEVQGSDEDSDAE